MYPVLDRHTKHGRTCLASEPYSRFGTLKQDTKDWMAVATKRMKRETDRAVFEEWLRGNPPAMSRGKGVAERTANCVSADREDVFAGLYTRPRSL